MIFERNAYYYNKQYNQEPILKKENKVYLVRKNIKTKRFSDKLDYKKLKLYKIKSIKKVINYKLELLKNIRIYLVFYVFFFKLVLHEAFRVLNIEIDFINSNTAYEIEKILNCKTIKKTIRYLITEKHYLYLENT